MEITPVTSVIISAVFGLVVSFGYHLIKGPRQPWPVWDWLAAAWVLACLCYIILFGVIKV